MKSLITKLHQNFHTLTTKEMLYYLSMYRWRLSKKERFFFEGTYFIPGQMYTAERKALYEAITTYKPNHCFEVGTYTGGGSTFFLTSAFKNNRKGKLYTMENDKRLFRNVNIRYKAFLPWLLPYVNFILGDEASSFDQYIHNGHVECVFLDGAEDSNQTLDQYNYFLPYFRKGTVLIVHDWNTEKTRELKPILTQDTQWKLIKEIKPPVSVGLVIFEML